jgi:hypothetical protein
MQDQYGLDTADIIVNYNPNPTPGGTVVITDIINGEAENPPPPPEEEVPTQEE